MVRMYAHTDVKFTTGETIKVVGPAGAKYLGALITPDGRSHKEVSARLQKTSQGFKAVSEFWKHTNLTLEWKLRIYTAVFLPMLLYGLETAHLTHSDLHRLERFHHKSLRRILKIPSTYYTKILRPDLPTFTHLEVRQKAGLPSISEFLTEKRMSLLGHLLRAPPTDLMRDVCFTQALQFRAFNDSRRVGRPRDHWAEHTVAEAWVRWQSTSPWAAHMTLEQREDYKHWQLEHLLWHDVSSGASPHLFLSHPLLTLSTVSFNRPLWYNRVCARQGAQ